jgi:hypothetical protein
MTAEKRKAPRRKIRHDIYIQVPVKCTLLDISLTGAHFTVENPDEIPGTFMIEIKPGLYRWCREAWRKGNEIGVEFTERPATIQTKKKQA